MRFFIKIKTIRNIFLIKMANTIKCFLETKHDSSSFELINKEKYIIGRNSKSLIKVNDPFCSREQGCLSR